MAYEPIRHSRWELVVMRVIFALLLWDTQSGWVGHLGDPVGAVKAMIHNPWTWDIPYTSQPHPNGLGHWIDFSFLSNNAIEQPLRLGMLVSVLLYAIGVPSVFSLALPLFFSIGTATLSNSQGAIGHMAHGLHLVLLVMWLAGAWSWWRKRQGKPLKAGFSTGQLEADWARQALSAAYVVSAITKLWESKGLWFIDARYVPLHMVKNNEMKFYQSLDENFLRLDWLPQVMLDHPLLCQVLFGVALPLELFVFIGLRNRRAAAFFGIGLVVFHLAVRELMSLFFFFNIVLLLTYFVFPWWWVAEGFKRLIPGAAPQGAGAVQGTESKA